MKALAGKAALVTGGSRGIGAAIARTLAAQGADVAITYRSAVSSAESIEREIVASGGRCAIVQADLFESGAAARAVDTATAAFGRLDIPVNNAGIFLSGPVDEANEAAVDRLFSIHARAVVEAARAAVPVIAPGGAIISIGSCLSVRVPAAGLALYAMSKAALHGLTRGLARDLGSRQVTTNLVLPGPIDTDMNPGDGEHASSERALVPLGRYGTPDEVAAMVAFLAGPTARYVNGACIAVEGGYSA
jgi:3-oxoacyl-[acyl-carrier protein] reductase